MSKRTTIALAVILVSLLAGSYAASIQQQAAKKTLPSRGASAWLDLDTGEIWSITILDTATGQRLAVSQKAEADWVLQSPITGTADAQKLHAWLGQWQFMYAQHTVTPTMGLDEFGLARPALVITFTAPSSTTVIHVGHRAPAVGGYYARQAGRPKVVVIGVAPVDEARQLVAAPPLMPTATPPRTPGLPLPEGLPVEGRPAP